MRAFKWLDKMLVAAFEWAGEYGGPWFWLVLFFLAITITGLVIYLALEPDGAFFNCTDSIATEQDGVAVFWTCDGPGGALYKVRAEVIGGD